MKSVLAVLCSLLLVCPLVVPTFAFVHAAKPKGNLAMLGRPKSGYPHLDNNQKHQKLAPAVLKLRGGNGAGGDPSTFLRAAGSDYSEAAKALFGNIIGPASMLTGGLVPLGFLAEPLPDDGKKWKKKAKCIYMALSVVSLVNELVAIMYATVATNKLTEVAVAPAQSVFALIKRDYELSWIGTNIHFMLGLFGFCGMVMLRALCIYPTSLNSATAGLALSALVGMASIVNVGVAEGDGRGHKLGGNIFSLGIRYVSLLTKAMYEKKTVLGLVSLVTFLYFGARTIQNLMDPESQKD